MKFAVESRLRGARLFKADIGLPFLEVGVNVGPRAFFINLDYQKRLFDPVSGREGTASSWSDGVFGTHRSGSGGREFVLSGLSRLLDRFLTEYLRVNETACTESPSPPIQ